MDIFEVAALASVVSEKMEGSVLASWTIEDLEVAVLATFVWIIDADVPDADTSEDGCDSEVDAIAVYDT